MMPVTGVERRRSLHAREVEVVHRRALPAMYVIDPELNVLHSRITEEHQQERRTGLRLTPRKGQLPENIGPTVRKLVGEAHTHAHVASAVTPDALIVRVTRLESVDESETLAVFVEPYRGREHLKLAKERYKLTRRETEVLELLIGGSKNRDIADKLVIAETTAIFHVKRLFEKTGTRSRMELISRAIA